MRLAPRPVFLAGREGLLAELDARLAGGAAGAAGGGVVRAGRRGQDQRGGRVRAPAPGRGRGVLAVPGRGPGGAGGGVRACWPPSWGRGRWWTRAIRWRRCTRCWPGSRPGGWWCSTTCRTGRRWSAFVPPAGPGRVLITTQNQHWPPGQALDVPVLDAEVAADFLVNRTGDPDRAAARELADRAGRAAAGAGAGRRVHAGHRDHPGPVPAAVPGPAGRPAGPRRGRRAPGGRGRHAGAGLVPAGGRCPGRGGAGAAAGVPGPRAGPADPAAGR